MNENEILECPKCQQRSVSFDARSGYWICHGVIVRSRGSSPASYNECGWYSKTPPPRTGPISEQEFLAIKSHLDAHDVAMQAASTLLTGLFDNAADEPLFKSAICARRLLGEVERLTAENEKLSQQIENAKDQYES